MTMKINLKDVVTVDEIQFRKLSPEWAIAYLWLKEGHTGTYLNKGDTVIWDSESRGKMMFKVARVDQTYYDGTCPVLYLKPSKVTARRLAEDKAKTEKKFGTIRT